MAKRRRLTAPDATALQEMEEGFAAKPQSNPFETNSLTPPIAQVAAEAAALSGMAAVLMTGLKGRGLALAYDTL